MLYQIISSLVLIDKWEEETGYFVIFFLFYCFFFKFFLLHISFYYLIWFENVYFSFKLTVLVLNVEEESLSPM